LKEFTLTSFNLPRNITLYLTETCNLRCKMCYFYGEKGCFTTKEGKREPKFLDYNIIKNVIADLEEIKPFYSLFGGEPLLHPQFKEIVKMIKGTGSIIDTPSNGTLIREQAPFLISAGFDSLRVSLDGPREVNDDQRGKGCYEKIMDGLIRIHQEKCKMKVKKPVVGLLYTVTTRNYDSIERLILKELDIKYIDWITIQMQNFITKEMARDYVKFLADKFNIYNPSYYKGMMNTANDFDIIDVEVLSDQVMKVREFLHDNGKNLVLLPPSFVPKSLKAYLSAQWNDMQDIYQSCLVPWVSADIVANGDVAPCHIFYDLVMGNLHDHGFKEIWNGHLYQKFREIMKVSKFMPICGGCCILYLAGKKHVKRR
jgi:radical SAM protein with 4Fe4S-binding SPASM domain